MINLRIYRTTLLLVPIAIGVAMFSLQSIPAGTSSTTAPDAFDGERAATLARELHERAPNPRPGSEADAILARQVGQSFGQLEGAQVSEQTFTHSFEGKEVELRNVICVLPGESDEQVVVMAGRDATRGAGLVTAYPQTAALLEIAGSFGGATHAKTLVFVSTDGTGLGAEGARRFASGYSEIDRVEAMIVLSQPAAEEPAQPLLVPWSTGPQSGSIELARIAALAISNETEHAPADESAFSELSRLAIPSGLGDQAPLVEDGFDAVRISSAGERSAEPGTGERGDISADSLGQFGRAALAVVLALDSSEESLEHGPDAYVGLFGNLVPGWALKLIALSLLAPLFFVSVSAMARALRKPDQVLAALAWVLRRSLPFIGVLLLAYILGFFGAIPDPDFPWDPGRFAVDRWGKAWLGVLGVVLVAGLIYIRALRAPPEAAGDTAGPVCVAVITLAGFGVWLANPYLALLVAPALHAWMLLAPEETAVGSVVAAGITFIGLIPLLIAVIELANRFGVGLDVVWQLLMLIEAGQISIWLMLLGAVLAGCALAALSLARSRIAVPPPEISISTARE